MTELQLSNTEPLQTDQSESMMAQVAPSEQPVGRRHKKRKFFVAAFLLVVVGAVAGLIAVISGMNTSVDNRSDASVDIGIPAGAPPQFTMLDSSTIDVRIARAPYISDSAFPYPPELTPLTLPVGGRKMTILSSIHSWRCMHDQGVIDVFNQAKSDLFLPLDSCSIIAKPQSLSNIKDDGGFEYKTNASELNSRDWARTYWGIADAGVARTPSGEEKLVSIHHGENANLQLNINGNTIQMQGTIHANVHPGACPPDAPANAVCNCASGYFNGVFSNCWESMGSFVSVSSVPTNVVANVARSNGNNDATQLSNFDQGPIVWPQAGFKSSGSGTKRSGGPYHPTIFINKTDGYTYAFYTKDWGVQPPFQNVFKCIGVARIPTGDDNPSNWRTMANGQFDQTALPGGFSKESVLNFLSARVPASDCINLPGSEGQNDVAVWFSVAKLVGTPYYIAIEEHSPNNTTYQINVRLSTNLIDWSLPNTIFSTDTNWGKSNYSYPTFYDRNGFSADEIDPSLFYVVGKQATNGSGYATNVMKACVSIPGVSNCPLPLDRAERLVQQYYRELLGWSIDRNDPGFQTHVSKLNAEGCFSDINSFFTSDIFINRTAGLSDKDFVRILHRAALSREPDSQGLEYWVGALRGTTRQNLPAIMFNSPDSWEFNQVCQQGKTLGMP